MQKSPKEGICGVKKELKKSDSNSLQLLFVLNYFPILAALWQSAVIGHMVHCLSFVKSEQNKFCFFFFLIKWQVFISLISDSMSHDDCNSGTHILPLYKSILFTMFSHLIHTEHIYAKWWQILWQTQIQFAKKNGPLENL